MAWVMHRFSEVFREHAIIKGGMASQPLGALEAAAETVDGLVSAAATRTDEHDIKLVEALIREHAASPSAELLSAGPRWLDR